MLVKAVRRLYAPEYLVKDSLKLGEIPSTKAAYSNAFTTAWASITETFLIALMSMMDMLMVGAVGAVAIAAVGLVTQPRFIVQTLVFALNTAVISVTARRRGQQDAEGAKRCLQQSLLLSLAISVVLSALAYALRQPIMLFAGAQSDTLGMSLDYFEVILLGIPASSLSLTICAAQRGIGNTKISMQINMLANLVNIVFNYLLIGGNFGFPQLGVRGAAIATVIGWVAGLLLAIYSVTRKDAFLYLVRRTGWKLDKQMMRTIFKVASGSFVEQICIRIGFVLHVKIAAGLGTILFAAHQILVQILSLSFSFGEGFGIAAASLVGRSMGEKRTDLSIVYGKCCQRMSYIASGLVFLLFVFAGDWLVLLFTDNMTILEVSRSIFWIMGVIIVAQSSQMILIGSLRGAGDTKYVAVMSLLCTAILRPTLSYVMTYSMGLGLVGVWLSTTVDQYLRLFLSMRRFSSGKWMSIQI